MGITINHMHPSAGTNGPEKRKPQNLPDIFMMSRTILFLLITGWLFISCSGEKLSDAYGQFETDEVIISAETPGKLLNFVVNEGERLEAGATAGMVDTTEGALRKKELEAAMASVSTKFANLDAQTEVYRSQMETAEKELRRLESLRQDDAATEQQLDRAAGEVNTLNRRMDAVEAEEQSVYAEQERIKVQIEQVQDQIRRAEIINPVSGTVLDTYAEAYEIVSPGKPLYRIASLDEMILRVYVSGAQLTQVRLGETADVLIDKDADSNERLTGTVSWVASRAEFTPRMIQTKEERVTQVYAVKIRVSNPEGKIKIGMPGEVNFNVES